MRMPLFAAAIAAATVSLTASGYAANLTGAGGTAIYPVLSKWAAEYAKQTGDTINYQPIGSGGGIKQIESKTVLFANTDMPLKPEEVAKEGLVQFPQVIISITPVVHLANVKAGELVFDGPTLADVFLGKLKYWDDAAIKKLNPKVALPHTAITTVHRSDGSGTTFNFTNYLSKVSEEWKSKVGEGTAVEWPTGVGAKGNEGVAANVAQTKNSIGYVEYAYAKQNKLVYTAMINKAAKKVEPNVDSFQAAASNADWTSAPGYYVILTDQPGEKSWPITASTFILMQRAPADKAASGEAIKFFKWAFANGGKMAEELDYIPMPENVVKMIEKTWSADIKS